MPTRPMAGTSASPATRTASSSGRYAPSTRARSRSRAGRNAPGRRCGPSPIAPPVDAQQAATKGELYERAYAYTREHC